MGVPYKYVNYDYSIIHNTKESNLITNQQLAWIDNLALAPSEGPEAASELDEVEYL